jgi:phage repressor protein C with HTH and peptisase S24 domain
MRHRRKHKFPFRVTAAPLRGQNNRNEYETKPETRASRRYLMVSISHRDQVGCDQFDAVGLRRRQHLPLSSSRDSVAIPPSLHRRMQLVTELSGHWSDATEAFDYMSSGHDNDVRIVRTYVNVESERPDCDKRRMMTTGETLMRLRARSGLSLEELAKAAGYAGRSGVQRYFNSEFERRLDLDVAERFANVLTGRGAPPIDRLEVLAVAGIAQAAEVLPSPEPALRYHDLPRDVPAYGTALGSFRTGDDDEVVEQTVLQTGDPIDFFQRPPGIADRRGVYGVYIAGSSQSPRFEEGEIAFVDPNRPPMIGDDVVVYLVADDGNDGDRVVAVLIKRLLRRTADFIELRQFNPALDFKVPARRVSAIHHVLTNAEMLSSR